MSFWNAAMMTPHRPVAIPMTSMATPTVESVGMDDICATTRMMPYTPVFIITPDMTADTCDGAAG